MLRQERRPSAYAPPRLPKSARERRTNRRVGRAEQDAAGGSHWPCYTAGVEQAGELARHWWMQAR